MSDRLTILVCSECGTASSVPDAEEHPYRCKCWKGPHWKLGTWFSEGIDWYPKVTEPTNA